jgi:hypothetical protein
LVAAEGCDRYLRTTKRRNKNGSEVRYLQLAHNEWDAAAGHSVVRVIHSFGREDQLDRAAIARLVRSLQRVLAPGEALQAAAGDELTFVESRPMGGAWVLDQLWRRLGVDRTLTGLLAGRRLDAGAERVLFAMVANRALEPLSKLAATRWVGERVAVPGVAEVDDDACYRAMDWLGEVEAELAEAVYWATADLLNLEVDLLFFDTTSTYFETGSEDEPAEGATVGFRSYGHSKVCVAQCASSHLGVSNSPTWVRCTWMRSPCRLPRRTCTAASSPRWTRCNTVWRATPRIEAASSRLTQPSGTLTSAECGHTAAGDRGCDLGFWAR